MLVTNNTLNLEAYIKLHKGLLNVHATFFNNLPSCHFTSYTYSDGTHECRVLCQPAFYTRASDDQLHILSIPLFQMQ